MCNDAEPNTEPMFQTENDEKHDQCPYPSCVVWWRTLDGRHSAIIGYSDGSICIVGRTSTKKFFFFILKLNFKFLALRPNCPLIANTCIERGAITKMVICTDSILNNVTVMVKKNL